MASGKLTLDRSTGMLKGRYSDLTRKLALALEPREENDTPNENAPTHTVYAATPGGDLTEVGAAWTKMIRNGSNQGQAFYTLTIDDPSFGASLHLAAFPMRDVSGKPVPGEYNVTWERAKAQSAAA